MLFVVYGIENICTICLQNIRFDINALSPGGITDHYLKQIETNTDFFPSNENTFQWEFIEHQHFPQKVQQSVVRVFVAIGLKKLLHS